MFVAIMGDRHRHSALLDSGQETSAYRSAQDDDRVHVVSLLEGIKETNPDAIVVTVGCDMGVGAMVKEECGRMGLAFLEVSMIIGKVGACAHRPPPSWIEESQRARERHEPVAPYACDECRGFGLMQQSEMFEFLFARNHAIHALCQVFYLLVRENRRGMLEHLVKLIKERPKQHVCYIYNEDNVRIEESVYPGPLEEDESD